MSKKFRDKGRLPPFIPLFKDTLKTPAWRALSHGARSLYVHLKMRYREGNNGFIYLSSRDASKEVGSNKDCVGRWFHELEHYGFIRMTTPGSLGLDGRGKSPHWRLTECGYMKEPPTRDFLNWDGTKFKYRPRRKQNPVPKNGDAVSAKVGTPPSPKMGAVAA
jgi:hypothetical protein